MSASESAPLAGKSLMYARADLTADGMASSVVPFFEATIKTSTTADMLSLRMENLLSTKRLLRASRKPMAKSSAAEMSSGEGVAFRKAWMRGASMFSAIHSAQAESDSFLARPCSLNKAHMRAKSNSSTAAAKFCCERASKKLPIACLVPPTAHPPSPLGDVSRSPYASARKSATSKAMRLPLIVALCRALAQNAWC